MPINILDQLRKSGRISPGPFVKSRGCRPWRPVIHPTKDGRELAVHMEVIMNWETKHRKEFHPDSDQLREMLVDTALVSGFYAEIDSREAAEGAFKEYLRLCGLYYGDALREPGPEDGIIVGS